MQLFHIGTQVYESAQKILPAGNTLHAKEASQLWTVTVVLYIYDVDTDRSVPQVETVFAPL